MSQGTEAYLEWIEQLPVARQKEELQSLVKWVAAHPDIKAETKKQVWKVIENEVDPVVQSSQAFQVVKTEAMELLTETENEHSVDGSS